VWPIKFLKDPSFLSATLLILVTIYLTFATYVRWFQLNFFIGSFRFTHWLSWIGTIYVAFFTPVYYALKRHYSSRLATLIEVHAFGNLFSFMLISIHFAQQIGRPAQFYPDLGTGLALYIVMLILAASGFLYKFQIIKSVKPHYNRFLHISITSSFYLIILIHVFQGLNIL
jgi:hypothetical protein